MSSTLDLANGTGQRQEQAISGGSAEGIPRITLRQRIAWRITMCRRKAIDMPNDGSGGARRARRCQQALRGPARPQDINLSIARGEVVVVIGPSGSGKSTLCRTINRLETIDDGTITLDGKALPRGGQGRWPALRAEVGMVFQSLQPLRPQDDPRERHPRPDQGARSEQVRGRQAGPRAARAGRGRRIRPTSTPPSSPADSSSASRSPGRSRWSRRSCSSTSRPPRSTRR